VWTGKVKDPRYEKAVKQLDTIHDELKEDGKYLDQ